MRSLTDLIGRQQRGFRGCCRDDKIAVSGNILGTQRGLDVVSQRLHVLFVVIKFVLVHAPHHDLLAVDDRRQIFDLHPALGARAYDTYTFDIFRSQIFGAHSTCGCGAYVREISLVQKSTGQLACSFFKKQYESVICIPARRGTLEKSGSDFDDIIIII